MPQTLGISDHRSRLPSRMAFSKIYILIMKITYRFFYGYFLEISPENGSNFTKIHDKNEVLTYIEGKSNRSRIQ